MEGRCASRSIGSARISKNEVRFFENFAEISKNKVILTNILSHVFKHTELNKKAAGVIFFRGVCLAKEVKWTIVDFHCVIKNVVGHKTVGY